MGYSVKVMGKAYAEGKYRTALNNAVHIVKDARVLEVVTAAYEAVKAGANYDEEVVVMGIKEVATMVGTEAKATEAVTVNTTEEVVTMEENTNKAVVTEEPAEENPWVLVLSKRRSTDLYVTVFEGDIKARLATVRKAGYTFVCVATIARYNNLIANNWARGKEVVRNLNKAGVNNPEEFVRGIVQLAAEMGYVCDPVRVNNTGYWVLNMDAIEEDDDCEEEAA